MDFWSMLGAALTLIAFIFVMARISRITRDNPERTQDLFRFKRITDDGFIELPEGLYRAMLEVEPINMYLKTPEEQQIIWSHFRDMLNSLHTSMTILVQSRHKDIKSYVSNLREMADTMPTENLKKFSHELSDYLEQEIMDKHVKDHRYYIILEVNPNIRESSFEIESELVDEIVSSFQKTIPPHEAEDLAKQELTDAMAVVASYLNALGMTVYRMDKTAILEMAYSALNRDLAPVTDFNGIIEASSIQTTSLTKTVIENQKEHKEVRNNVQIPQKSQERVQKAVSGK